MKKYKITVDGVTYEVEVEEVSSDGAVSAPVAAAPAAESKPVAAPAAGAKTVNSPMPGTILKVNVKKGDKVKKGDVLCVLEAMKMENDIQAAEDAVVAEVHVSANSTVETGTPLISLS